ncbi:MAG: N-acetylmuramoyl-L-alanine amidase [Bacillota bacterium]
MGLFATEVYAQTGIVATSVLNIREGPGTDYAKKGSLLKGAQVDIVGRNGDWLSIRLKSGITGWVHSDYVKTANASQATPPDNTGPGTVQTKTGTVTGSVVNVRAGAGTQYAKKGSVTRGATVTVLGQQASWINIRLSNGVTGWIHADYLQVAADPAPGTAVSGVTNGSKIEVTGNTVNLRQGPGTNYSTQGQVKKGDQLPLLGEKEGWYKVQTSRGVAYLAGYLARVLTAEPASAEEIPSPSETPTNPQTEDPGTGPGTGPDGYDVVEPEPETPDPSGDNHPLPTTIANRVVLDPGHGGHDPGATGYSGSYEKEVNLALARKTADLLRAAGFEVLMTRDDDRYVSLNDRVSFANSSQAAAFVSIHCNGSTSSDTNGTEVYYYVDQNDPIVVAQAEERARLASVLYDSLLRGLGLKDNGVRQNNYIVVRYTQIPAVLIETAYLTNLNEEVLLNDPAFQDMAAQAIANGIMEYLNSIRV